jgi:predicted nucleotidyltransferase
VSHTQDKPVGSTVARVKPALHPNAGAAVLQKHTAPANTDRRSSENVMHHLIEQRRAEIAHVCRRYGVRQLEVFGSAARGADFEPATSDADFLVDFQPGENFAPLEQFFGLADALARLLGRPVDLLEHGAVRNPFLLAGINRAREVVYAA